MATELVYGFDSTLWTGAVLSSSNCACHSQSGAHVGDVDLYLCRIRLFSMIFCLFNDVLTHMIFLVSFAVH